MSCSVKITVLVENTVAGRGVLGEHGFCCCVEIGQRRLLWDTGQGQVLEGNARNMGLDLARTEAVLLSHGHYDHTGGLGSALAAAPEARVLGHPAVLGCRYARKADGSSRPVGLASVTPAQLRRSGRFAPVCEPHDLGDGLCLTGEIPRSEQFEDVGGPFFLDEACTRPDPIPDDQAMFFQTEQGSVVLLGCAHAGLINTLKYVQKLTRDDRIHTVMGGMHLCNAGKQRLDSTINALDQIAPDWVMPCHCTGFVATKEFVRKFPAKVLPAPVGTHLEWTC